MKNSLMPLIIFVVGNLVLLLITLAFGVIDEGQAQVAAHGASVNASAVIWGWDWIMADGMSKALLYTAIELGIIAAAGVVYVKNKKR